MANLTRKYTREDILSVLSATAEKYGRSITVSEWKRAGIKPVATMVIKEFGSWCAAWEAIGLSCVGAYTLRSKNRETARLTAQESLRKAYKDYGRALSIDEWRKGGYHPSSSSVIKIFGLWTAAWESIDVEPISDSPRAGLSNEQILDRMREVYQTYGRALTHNEWHAEHLKPSASTIITRFNGWVNAWQMAGVPVQREFYNPGLEEWFQSRRDARIARIREVYERHGRAISPKEWDSFGYKPASASLRVAFGRWPDVWAQIGVAWSIAASLRSTILQAIQRAFEDHGEVIPMSQWTKEHRKPGVRSILQEFPDWYDAWVSAIGQENAVFIQRGSGARDIVLAKGRDSLIQEAETDKERKILELYLGGMSFSQIGEMYGVTRQRIHQIIKRISSSNKRRRSHMPMERDELLRFMAKAYIENGNEPLTHKEWTEHYHTPSYTQIRSKIGGWDLAWELAAEVAGQLQ